MDALDRTQVHAIIGLAEACYPPRRQSAVTSTAEPGVSIGQRRPEHKRLFEYVASLDEAGLAELYALMLLGRGDGGEQATDWDLLVSLARERQDPSLAHYIADKAPLARYLQDGLDKLGEPAPGVL